MRITGIGVMPAQPSAAMPQFDSRTLAFAANCTIAALAALFVAMSFGLSNPWWAALTVLITSQPFAAASGAVVARALFRLAGTIAGVAASLLIVPALAGTPGLMIAAIALWLGVCVTVSLLVRGPGAYAFMLAGYTVALVGLPLATDPGSLFDSAVARTEEIGIGTVFAALVQNLLLPRSLRETVLARLTASLADTRRWLVGALGTAPVATEEQAARRRLAVDLVELRALAANLRFEPGVDPTRQRVVVALEERLVALLPLMTAVEDRLQALAEIGPQDGVTLPPGGARDHPQLTALFAHVATVRAWIDLGEHEDPAVTARLLAASAAAQPAAGSLPTGIEALAHSVARRADDLVRAWDEALLLADALRDPHARLDPRVPPLLERTSPRALHLDVGLAAFSGLAAALSATVMATICWFGGWQQGAAGVGIAAAGVAVFAFADDPRPMQRTLLAWAIVAVPVSALYVFALLPAADGFAGLALVLGPLFFVNGLYMATPAHSLRALGFALISQSLISVQTLQHPDFSVFMNIAIGAVMGNIVALAVTHLVRVISAEWSTWRLLRAGWLDLAALARGRNTPSTAEWSSTMLDRVGLLVPRIAQSRDDQRVRLADALRDLRLGVSVSELRAASAKVVATTAARVHGVLDAIGAHFERQARRGHDTPAPELLRDLDATFEPLSRIEDPGLRARALAAAIGVRRALFPRHPLSSPPAEAS